MWPAGNNAARRAAEEARHQRLRQAARIHALGVRATVEFVEAARLETRDPGKFDRLLSRFAELDANLLRRLGGDRLPPLPAPRRVS